MCLDLAKISLPSRRGTASGSSDGSQQLGFYQKYETALKTKSFNDFCREVHKAINVDLGLDLDPDLEINGNSSSSSFTDLLSPDKKHVNILLLQQTEEIYQLISSYLNQSEAAFKLCGTILKSAQVARRSYTVIQNILDLADVDLNEERCHLITKEFNLFIESENPFLQTPFEGICEFFQDLRENLESAHRNLVKKHRLASLEQILFPESVRLFRRESAQVNAAARGAYVLKNHLQTIQMLVARLYNEVDNSKNIMRICQRIKYEICPLQEVMKLLKRNDCKFVNRLDEIGEQACFCLLNINRARRLLLQEIHTDTNQ